MIWKYSCKNFLFSHIFTYKLIFFHSYHYSLSALKISLELKIPSFVICITFKYQIFHKLKKIRQKLFCSNVAFHKGLTNYKFIDSVKRECIVAITRKRERDARGSEEHGWGHKTRILRFLRGLSSMRCISRCIRLSVLHTYLIHSSHPRSAVRLHRVSVGSATSEET